MEVMINCNKQCRKGEGVKDFQKRSLNLAKMFSTTWERVALEKWKNVRVLRREWEVKKEVIAG